MESLHLQTNSIDFSSSLQPLPPLAPLQEVFPRDIWSSIIGEVTIYNINIALTLLSVSSFFYEIIHTICTPFLVELQRTMLDTTTNPEKPLRPFVAYLGCVESQYQNRFSIYFLTQFRCMPHGIPVKFSPSILSDILYILSIVSIQYRNPLPGPFYSKKLIGRNLLENVFFYDKGTHRMRRLNESSDVRVIRKCGSYEEKAHENVNNTWSDNLTMSAILHEALDKKQNNWVIHGILKDTLKHVHPLGTDKFDDCIFKGNHVHTPKAQLPVLFVVPHSRQDEINKIRLLNIHEALPHAYEETMTRLFAS
jgi:hypothetical protein